MLGRTRSKTSALPSETGYTFSMSDKDYRIDELDPVRSNLLTLSKDSGLSLANLSNSLGKNPAYLQQYVRRGSPKKLPEELRYELATLLSVDEEVLGGTVRPSKDTLREPATPDHRKNLKGFAARLSSARQKAGFYTQSGFALETGMPLERYVVLERGDDDPTIAELDIISATAGISLNWLVKG